MAGDPVPSEERGLRLQRVREEIQRGLGQGITLSDADWMGRYPDLEPELRVMLRELIGSGMTQVAGRTAGALETIAGRSDPSPEAPPVETIASSTPPEPATLGDPDADMARMPSGQERTADLASDARSTPGVAQAAVPATGWKVRYIGDYETISILGQGGMGVVYKARQLTLNRLVALKMIRNAEFASEDQVRRFQNEAEAVATLDHPGIVPIYEVGTFEDQRYFSMKLVEGQGLDKKLEELAKNPRAAARVVAEVADAVNHAHQRGILHRDLKPANILMDGQGHTHVTDFGLAKRIEEDAGLTVSGAIMGTPSYMAPEQAGGQSSLVTTASDVYGLGAILYAALTGRAPFVGDSVMNTLDQVRTSPPQSPTRLNATLPRDLEVICLKCLEKAPRHRYASAQALSDDLNRWLRDEPIAARPVGPIVRLRMWAKRKPALAGLSAALLIASIAGVIGVTWQWREAISQRNQAQIARDEAVHLELTARKAEAEARIARDEAVASEKKAVGARAQAEQNAQIAGMQATLALNTIQDLVSQVQKGLHGPGLYDLKAALLASALKRIDGVAGIYEKSTSKEATTAAALMELGKIYRQLGQTQKAFQSFQKCLEITKERVKIKNYSDPSRQNLANTYFELAFCSEELNRDMKATLNYNQYGLNLYEDIYNKPKFDDFPLDRKVVRAGLAEAYTRVGVTLYRMGELTTALENYRKAYNLRRELADEIKDNPRLKQDLSYSMMALAETNFRLGNRTLADDLYHQVLDQREAMAKLDLNDLTSLKELGDVYYMIGEFKLRCGDLAAARRNLENSRDRRKDLVAREPRNVLLGRDLGLTWYRLGNLAELEKDASEARRLYEASLTIREDLAKISEGNDRRQTELMLALAHVGQTARALELADRFSVGPNVDREQRIYLASCYAQVARATLPEKSEQVQTALVKAVGAVRAAVREGFRDRVYLETEPDLEPIRNRDDFKQILGEIRPG
jgi:tetratricopeptide (TPR) repeat protein/tRNA A-37 threonylcarbamoyl transferase component Bud32